MFLKIPPYTSYRENLLLLNIRVVKNGEKKLPRPPPEKKTTG